jgi:4-oxalomesaconate tautomerase
MLTAIPTTLMRGGTSRGAYFDSRDLPSDDAMRKAVLLAVMGSPDIRQIDGLGGAHPLTSKVAVISAATRDDADVDYLFLQVAVDRADVSDAQNCGNILAGVGPWAIEHKFVAVAGDTTPVRIHMVNTGGIAVAHVQTPDGDVEYQGDARIDGVPGTAAAIPLDFLDVAGASCGALLPTGNVLDTVDGTDVTCIDNGMPVVVLRASDFGLSGVESPREIEADKAIKARIERLRLELGPRMNLGDVSDKTVPKMSLISPPQSGGIVSTRTFIPHRVHEAIGVLGAVSVATACLLPGSVAEGIASSVGCDGLQRLDVEHPSGFFTLDMELEKVGDTIDVKRSALLRTARKLMEGRAFIPGSVWAGS